MLVKSTVPRAYKYLLFPARPPTTQGYMAYRIFLLAHRERVARSTKAVNEVWESIYCKVPFHGQRLGMKRERYVSL